MGVPERVTFGYEIGVELKNKHRYSFDITDAVQSWVSDGTAKSKGIIFKATDSLESGSAYTYRTLASYNRSSNKPSLSVTYNYASGPISSATGKNYVVEGGALALTANDMDGTITWTSSNTSIATVSSNGVVTGKLAGSTTITASCPDYEDAKFTVWVTVADGVYFIKNAASGLCLSAGGTASIESQTLTASGRIPQLWKISYIYDGYYSIRPLRDFSTALGENSSSYAGTVDATPNDSVLSTALRWRITHNAFGYYFALVGSTADILTPVTSGTPGSSVYLGTWQSNLTCHWTLSKITGVFLRDTATHELLTEETPKYMVLGDTATPAELNIGVETYGSSTGSAYWFSSNSSVAGMQSGEQIVCHSVGKTTIGYTASLNGSTYTQSVPVYVVLSSGTYYIQNQGYGTYMQIDDNASTNFSASNAMIEVWPYLGVSHQQWVIDHLGEGYYKIISAESGLALTLRTEYANTNEMPIVQQAYSESDGQKWYMDTSANGGVIIRAKAAESYETDWCLAVGDESGSDDGVNNVEQAQYTLNSDLSDEWMIRRKNSLLMIHYYDQAFIVREEDAANRILSYSNAVAARFNSIFGLTVYTEVNNYTSVCDECKIELYGSVARENMDSPCTHLISCLTTARLRSQLISDFGSGSVNTTRVLWTGNRMGDNEGDRSNSQSATHTVIITPYSSWPWDNNLNAYRTLSQNDRDVENIYVLMHEASHQLGAHDHYCNNDFGLSDKCSNPYCDKCYNGTSLRKCLMSYSFDISTVADSDMYCTDCIAIIEDHLEDHH